MGTQSSTMKAFIFTSALLALATADTSTIAARLSSEESIAVQQGILVGGLCPTSEDPALCEANLPGFWAGIAAILWPGYWDPSAEWMCGPICEAPEDTIMEFLSGDFCASTGEDRCPEFVDVVIRQGLPMIYAASNDEAVTETCNAAVEGTCP